MNIREMEAERELDALVAEKVFGYKRVKVPKDYDGLNGGTDVLIPPHFSGQYSYPPRGKIALWHFVKDYSTDIYDAWEVTEKFHLNINNVGYGDKKYHVVINKFDEEGELTQFEAFGETASLAICRASLLAMEDKA